MERRRFADICFQAAFGDNSCGSLKAVGFNGVKTRLPASANAKPTLSIRQAAHFHNAFRRVAQLPQKNFCVARANVWLKAAKRRHLATATAPN